MKREKYTKRNEAEDRKIRQEIEAEDKRLYKNIDYDSIRENFDKNIGDWPGERENQILTIKEIIAKGHVKVETGEEDKVSRFHTNKEKPGNNVNTKVVPEARQGNLWEQQPEPVKISSPHGRVREGK